MVVAIETLSWEFIHHRWVGPANFGALKTSPTLFTLLAVKYCSSPWKCGRDLQCELGGRDRWPAWLEVFGHDAKEEFDNLTVSMPDRPFSDKDYVIDGDRLKALGWDQQVPFAEGRARTADWYRAQGDQWWTRLLRLKWTRLP